ncbi:MAG: hypothetical protein AAFQ37_02245, partial [Bacteroidota bacterium]
HQKDILLDGEESFVYPMIRLGQLNWLPSIRFGLTPFGSEFIIENYFKRENTLLGVNLRLGDGKLDNFWGGGLSFFKRVSERIQIRSNADIWFQPSMALGGRSIAETNEGVGGRIIGALNLRFSPSSPVGLYSQLGYKSTGFIEGERLDKGLIFRVGLSFKNEK